MHLHLDGYFSKIHFFISFIILSYFQEQQGSLDIPRRTIQNSGKVILILKGENHFVVFFVFLDEGRQELPSLKNIDLNGEFRKRFEGDDLSHQGENGRRGDIMCEFN